MRSAISPRLAIRIFSNMAPTLMAAPCMVGKAKRAHAQRCMQNEEVILQPCLISITITSKSTARSFPRRRRPIARPRGHASLCPPYVASMSSRSCADRRACSLDDHQRFAELHRLGVFEQDLDHRARLGRGDLVHRLHRLDDEERLAGLDDGADLAECLCAG